MSWEVDAWKFFLAGLRQYHLCALEPRVQPGILFGVALLDRAACTLSVLVKSFSLLGVGENGSTADGLLSKSRGLSRRLETVSRILKTGTFPPQSCRAGGLTLRFVCSARSIGQRRYGGKIRTDSRSKLLSERHDGLLFLK